MAEHNRGNTGQDYAMLVKELEASRMIHEQITKLNCADDLKSVLQQVLATVGTYMCAERAYIFEEEADGTYSNTYEWCAENICAEIDSLQHVPRETAQPWLDRFKSGQCVAVSHLDEVKDTPDLYEILARQNIQSVIEAPIMLGNEILGFIGVDNADAEMPKLIAQSLMVLGSFLATVIRNREEREQLRKSHADMKDSRDMQQEIVGSINCGVFAYTIPEYKVLAVNNVAKRIIGCGETDDPIATLLSFWKDKIIPSDRQRLAQANERPTKTGDMVRYIYQADVDGKRICVQSNVKLLRFSNGQAYILCTMLDITEQFILTNSLTKERKAYRDALANGSEYNFFFDVTEGFLREEFITTHGVNLIRDLGFSTPVRFDELLAKYRADSGIEFVNPEMEAYFTRAGLIKAYENGITNAISEYYNPKRDIFLRVNCLLSRDDETGHIHASVVADDVTESHKRLQAQQAALKAANEKLNRANDEMNMRLDAILDGISGGLKIIDVENHYSYAYISEGAARLQGYTVADFLAKYGKRVTSNIYENDGEAVLAEANRQIAEKGSYAIKYRVIHKDGSIRWVIDRGKLMSDSNTGKKLYYTLMQDVTELENRNAMLSNILLMQEQMADSLGSGIFAYTIPEYKILILNQEAKRMFDCMGSDRSQFGKDIIRKIIPEDLPAVRAAEKALRHPGDHAEYIFHSRSASGTLLTFKCHTKLLSFSSGQQYILSSLTDITEQELMEKRLDEERQQYRKALAFGCKGFFSVDLTDGWLYEPIISEEGENLTDCLGLKPPVMFDKLASEWLSEKRIITESDKIELVQSGEHLIEYCQNGGSMFDFEYHIPAKGTYYHILVLLYPINGHIHASFIIYDITATRHEEKQRRAIIDSLGKMYLSLYHLSLQEQTGIVLKINDDIASELAEHFDFTNFYNIYIEKYVLPEFKETVSDFLNPASIQAALVDREYTSIEFKRKNVGWYRINLVASERDANGIVTAVVFAGTVIESRKQAELAQQEALRAACESANIANSAKTNFLANMSHDIRTPMNAIIGMTAIAGTHLDDKERVADCLSKISISSKHLLGIINEVLDMSKIESGKMDLQEEAFNLPELIENLLTMSMPEVSAKKHELLVSIHKIEHENVIGDSSRIQQAFMNLMSNAIKYTPAGGKIRLNISEKSTNKPKIGCYEFIFEDNGIGMSEEFQRHIFDPFARAVGDPRVEKIQGTGLGMPITKNIVQMMNGDIKVESELDAGTKITVTVFLPLQNIDDPIDYDKFVDLSVLVADDDETACMYTCEMLNEIGMKGEWVLTGQEAVACTVEHHQNGNDFFAVILDWKMPGMDGIETTRQIRKRVGKHVPIIIISAYDWSDIELEARAAGANAFISKPFFKSRMVHLFHELIGGEKEEKISELSALTQEDFTGKRALLVEDNALNAEIAEEILNMTGLTVEFARDGKEALDIMTRIEDDYFSVVFMDIQMPIMNGYEASRAIRALPRDYTKSVPIIAMTANAFAEDVAAAKNAGMNEHIAKPLDFRQLLTTLKKWIV